MSNESFCCTNFISFCTKFGKRGFTLAEALIITIMTGCCLLPILGTMQNAQVRTQNYNHQSKMQHYSRSRLNAEIANSSFDHKYINSEDEYHYIVYLDYGKNGDVGKEKDAKLVELPKTSVTLNKMINFMSDSEGRNNNHEDVWNLLGVVKGINPKPYLKVVHAYETTVEFKEQSKLSLFGSNDPKDDFKSSKALLGIVVKTCLLQSEDSEYDKSTGKLIVSKILIEGSTDEYTYVYDETEQVLPVTLFSLVNLPIVSEETIWLADALNCKIYGIDPVSKSISSVIKMDVENSSDLSSSSNNLCRPWHIAAHPNLRLLAVLRMNDVQLVNIDKNGSQYGQIMTVGNDSSICNPTNVASEAYQESALAFRPDGKYLYCYSSTLKKLLIYSLTCDITNNLLTWNDSSPSFIELKQIDFDASKDIDITGLVPANDGYLYLSFLEGSNKLFRVPMYTSLENMNKEDFASLTSKIYSIDVSPDGTKLAVITDECSGTLRIYDTRSRKLLKNKTIYNMGNNFGAPFKTVFVAVSSSTQDITNINSLGLTITNNQEQTRTDEEDNLNLAKVFNKKEAALIRGIDVNRIDNTEKIKGSLVVSSPDNKSVIVADQINPQIYIAKTGVDTESEKISETDETLLKYDSSSETNNCSDLTTTKRNILAVAEGTTVKLYDLNIKKEIEETEFNLANPITSISMNPQGDFLLSCHSTATGSYLLNLTDNSIRKPEGINAYRNKVVFDDNYPYMAFALQTPIGEEKKFYNISHTSHNLWEKVAADSYDRRAYTVGDWNSLDMIGMPNGGALVLYGKVDGSSMIEWIGRRNWDQDPLKGKYKLFARWTNVRKTTKYSIPSAMKTGFENLDSANGSIIIVAQPLKKGSMINSVNIKAGKKAYDGTWTSGSRYITPILLKKKPNYYEVINRAKPIELNAPNKIYYNIEVSWREDTFDINEDDTYYIGWWNGGGEKGRNEGAVAFDSGVSNAVHNCKSDLYDDEGHNEFTSIPNKLYDTSSNCRNYAIQFRYISDSEFPPLYSQKLAISQDGGTLAILSKKSDTDSYLGFYDFNNQIYGPETQIEGMLVDYRDNFDSGAEFNNYFPIKGWPEESSSIFYKSVKSHTHFNGLSGNTGLISSLASATTKYDSWSSFNKYPANYWFDSGATFNPEINEEKSIANKRFIGYYRPEVKRCQLQRYGSDEPRFFLNKAYIGGRYEVLTNPLDSAIGFFVNEKENVLFQIDEASNANGMFSSIFLNSGIGDIKDFDNSFVSPISNDTDKESQFYEKNHLSIEYLTSSETYILKNLPPHINTETLTNIDPLNSNIIFSRDKTRPVLYLLDKTNKKLWNSKSSGSIMNFRGYNINSNPIITTDGQSLVFVANNSLKAVDITSDIISGSSDLINLSKSEEDKSKTRSIANKPFCTITSGNANGTYTPIIVSNPYNEYVPDTNSAMTVANGGIYIFNNKRKGFLCYNPRTNDFRAYENVLLKNALFCPITSYDNSIYIFGNNGSRNDPLSNRVQCYDLNTEKALESQNAYDDEYQVNMGIRSDEDNNNKHDNIAGVGHTGDAGNYIKGHSMGNPCHAFTTCIKDYTFSNSSNPYIEINFDSPLTINKIKLSNYCRNSSRKRTRIFKLEGSNDSSDYTSILETKDIKEHSNEDFSKYYTAILAPACYKNYKLKLVKYMKNEVLQNCGSGDNSSMVKLIQLWRTGVKRLTPPLKGIAGEINQSGNTLTWCRDNGLENTVMEWTYQSDDDYSFRDIYIKNETDGNNFFKNQSEGWEVRVTPKPKIKISLSSPEAVCAVRYANSSKSNKSKIKSCKLYGSNNESPDITNYSEWNELIFTNGSEIFESSEIHSTFVTAEIKNPTKYKHYLFEVNSVYGSGNNDLRLIGFELFACPTDNYLTSLLTDELAAVKVGAGAACATPYGLVTAGGHIDDDRDSYATPKALLYWPHAANKYDGTYYQYGISRSLPSLYKKRFNHALVWQKGKIYAISGSPSSISNFSAYPKDMFAECLDYNNMSNTWDAITLGSYTAFIDGASSDWLSRYYQGTCSFGDEIFVFGGRRKDTDSEILNTAFAWNPETGVVRRIGDLPEEIRPPICAVACGSKIYMAGKGVDGKLMMFEYTP